MGAIDVSRVTWSVPGGRTVLDEVSFRVGDGEHVALVGANGVGKTTLLKLIARDETGHEGTIAVDGRLGVMRQFIGSAASDDTVRDLLVSLASAAVRDTAAKLAAAEAADRARPDEASGMALAAAWAAWAEVQGFDAEVAWDACTTRVLRLPLEEAGPRPLNTLSGGEQKRLALEARLRSDFDVLLLDEPDNYLDVPSKEWLEEQLRATSKTVLYVSHDRQLLAATATKVVTIEGRGAWTHGGSFETYHDARDSRLARLDDDHRRWQDERRRLHAVMREMKRRAAISDANASRARASETRLRHFDEAGPPPERPQDQSLSVRLGGGRTGKRVVTCEHLALSGLTESFDVEVHFGDRVAVLGRNGTGKSHFLRLLAGQPVEHTGRFALGARVVPGWFSQTNEQPALIGRTPLQALAQRDLPRGPAMAALRRYELHGAADQPYDTLSGGQQARLQVLLLELAGATLLLLDEPTDNLDLASAEALEDALGAFEGTVLAVTHDRWFMRSFDRFVVFDRGGGVSERDRPVFD